jgi:hypothetical protein
MFHGTKNNLSGSTGKKLDEGRRICYFNQEGFLKIALKKTPGITGKKPKVRGILCGLLCIF